MKNFTSDVELYNWVIDNISYHGVSKKILFSEKDIYKYKKGHCWELASFCFLNLQRLSFVPTIFFIENNDSSATHTFLIYSKNNMFVWFETAWYKYIGIHKYKTMKDLIKDVTDKFIIDNKDIRQITFGYDAIGQNTLQIDYYNLMSQKWSKYKNYDKNTILTKW